jgi:uncharacterized membrane-anchored protein
MQLLKTWATVLGLVLLIPSFGLAEEEEKLPPEIQKLIDGLKYQTGEVVIGNNLATIALPENFRYLGPEDTDTILVKLWGNPPDETKNLGLIAPADFHPLQANSWVVVLTHENDGHIKDKDADSINYTKLLKEMQASMAEENKERTKAGYKSIQLVGWATPPRYDKEGKKLYWAKELAFGEQAEHTLNYNIRILGRTGVLNLNAIANMDQLQTIEAATPDILQMVSFNPGHRYADFNESTDKLATYGLAALVAGGVAAKTGLLKGLIVALLAFKKVIILGVVGAGTAIAKLFKGKNDSA